MSVVFGDRVVQARALRGLPVGALAQRLGWRPERLSRLLRQYSVELDDSAVIKLQEVLRVPETFLRTAPASFVTQRRWTSRPPASMSQRERTFLTQFAAVVEEFIDQVTLVNPLPPLRLQQCRHGSVDMSAAAARQVMGVCDGPIPSLTTVMEAAGIPVVMRSPSSAGSVTAGETAASSVRHLGLSVWMGEFGDRPLVMMPALSSWERTRWTLAHELGHICLHTGSVPAVDAEQLADAFAGELLAPVDQVAPELPHQVTLAALLDVKTRWGISIQELIRHLARHHVIHTETARSLQRQLHTRKNRDTGRSWGVAEPGANDRKAERPRMLLQLLQRCTGSQSPREVPALPGSVLPPDMVAALLAHQSPSSNAGVTDTEPAAEQRDEQ